MPAAAFTKYHQFVQDLGRKVHNLNTDVLKIAFTNRAPVVATDAVLADISQITAEGGYPAGGITPTNGGYVETAGVGALILGDKDITATGTFGPFKYAVLYNSTAAGGPLIAYYEYPQSIYLNVDEVFLVDFPSGGVVLEIE